MVYGLWRFWYGDLCLDVDEGCKVEGDNGVWDFELLMENVLLMKDDESE